MATKRDCISAIKSAAKSGTISDAEAREIIQNIATLAANRAREKSMNLHDATREIAGELMGRERTAAAIDHRNKLLSQLRLNQFIDRVTQFDTWGDGVAAFLGGTEKAKVEGAGLSIDAMIRGIRGTTLRRLFATLDDAGVLKDFLRARHSREFYIEAGELSRGADGKPGITENPAALAMARAWHEIRTELVARANRAGAWIESRPDYVVRQSHDSDAVRRLGREGFGQASKEQSFRAWKEFVLPLLDQEASFKGTDPETWLKHFHESIYSEVYGPNRADNHLEGGFTAHGSAAKKISAPRHMHFKDAESAWKYNEAFGTKNFSHAVTGSIESLTRQIILSEHLGPNYENNFHVALRQLSEDARKRDDADRQADSINKNPKLAGYFDLLTGKANQSKRPTFSKWIDRIRNVTLSAKSGSIVLSSFGDKGFFQSEMAYQGISQLETLGKQFTAMLPKGRARTKALREMDIALTSLAGDITHRWNTEGRPNGDPTQTIVNTIFDLNLSNLWTDSHKNAASWLIAHNAGDHASKAWGNAPSELRRVLKHYDIQANEWNAIRSTTWTSDEGHNFITADKFRDIPNDLIDPLLEGKGLSATNANRTRERDLLATKYSAYISDRVDHAIPSPGVRERYYLTGGAAQRGTYGREAFELLAIFKSFPTAVIMRVMGRERYGRGYDTALEWLLNDHKGKMNMALTIAATGALGYLSMTVKDMLKGRTRKQLLDENGNPNMRVFFAALQQGGGLGIYGDFLFSEYGRQYRSVLGAIAGPAFGQMDTIGEILTKARTAGLEADADKASEVGADLVNLGINNMPGGNLFYIRPVLDYFILWNLKEMLSPGVLRRAESSIEQQNVQEFWITPSEVAPLSFDEKIEHLGDAITE